MTDGKLIVFLRNPEIGKVKTRLAQQIGEGEALAVYYKLISRTRDVTNELSRDKAVFYSRYVDREDGWDDKKYGKYLQKGNNMGERMSNAMDEVLAEGYSKVVLIGSDIYKLRTEILEEAFDLLDSHEAVIGPAMDGGYYLIGLKQSRPKLFDLKYWSTPNVFSETVKRLKSLGMTYAQTPLLNDIDELNDLKGTDLYSPG